MNGSLAAGSDPRGPGGVERSAGRVGLPGPDMLIGMHKNATTTLAERLAIQ